jgi:hypothetical protein
MNIEKNYEYVIVIIRKYRCILKIIKLKYYEFYIKCFHKIRIPTKAINKAVPFLIFVGDIN